MCGFTRPLISSWWFRSFLRYGGELRRRVHFTIVWRIFLEKKMILVSYPLFSASKERIFGMMNKVALFCAACVAALHGLAADKYYLVKAESSNSNGGFYNPSYWSSNGENTGTITQEFDPDAEYVVYKKSGSKIYIKAAPDGKTYDFGGGSLVLGQGTSFGALYNYVYDTSENDKKVLGFLVREFKKTYHFKKERTTKENENGTV